jgi:adenine C2-methylase RlmN of 23S rRNA A2503 and tRNA A37/regulator of sirC expression with transglutaminase-like and TPR domain
LNEEETVSTELSKAGYRYLREGRLEEANESFNGILEINPENNYALVGLGEVARKQRNFQKAIEYYQACLQFHPGNKYALIGLADCYRAQSAYQKAIEIWEQYLNQDDQDVTVLTRIADAYRKVKNFEKSKELYLKALEIEAENPYALNGLGHLHFDFKYYNEAVPYWERMLKNDPKNIKVMTSMGNCYRKTKDFHGGLPYFERALEIEPSNFYALFGIADCCRGLNRHKDSLEAWKKILDSDPNNKIIITRAGDAYRNLGDLEQAEHYYKRALNMEFDMYAVIGLALISKHKGDHLQAIESLTGLLAQNPKNHRLVIEIADSYVKVGNSEAAIDTITRFLRLGGKNARVSEMFESVMLPDERGRSTACLSTQVGCGMGCRFCRTGALGYTRDLLADEIVDQFLLLRSFLRSGGLSSLSRELSNVVFMGMGEPLANLDNLHRAVDVLSCLQGSGFSTRRMTVSTCGLVEGIHSLRERKLPVRLAVSLVSADSEVRAGLMPVARSNPLPELRRALLEYQAALGKRITLEIVLMDGINDRPEDVEALVRFVRGEPSQPPLRVLINLIPWNPLPDFSYRKPEAKRIEWFQRRIKQTGIPVTTRLSRGSTVCGACGQLG